MEILAEIVISTTRWVEDLHCQIIPAPTIKPGREPGPTETQYGRAGFDLPREAPDDKPDSLTGPRCHGG